MGIINPSGKREAAVCFKGRVGQFGEDSIDWNVVAAFDAFTQVALGIEGGELFGEGTADELVDRDAFAFGQALCVLVQGIR